MKELSMEEQNNELNNCIPQPWVQPIWIYIPPFYSTGSLCQTQYSNCTSKIMLSYDNESYAPMSKAYKLKK